MHRAGARAVVAAGASYEAIRARAAADDLVVRFAPQIALLPRMTAVIGHGGNNSTNETLRAGKPLVVVPFGGEQIANARRVEALGVGVALESRTSHRRAGGRGGAGRADARGGGARAGAGGRRSRGRRSGDGGGCAGGTRAYQLTGAAFARLLVVVPSPSCPRSFWPQQSTVPSPVRAHAWLAPTTISTAPDTPATFVGAWPVW